MTTAATSRILDRLNPEQRAAAEAVHGPVAILAGAGTGKTTTITHRIAWQVHSGEFTPRQLLAVTFTSRAADVLRRRLEQLDVRGVEARTFHSAALWQLRVMWQACTGTPLPEVLPTKARMLRPIVDRLGPPWKFRPLREYATEIEWAKNRRVTVDGYEAALAAGGHEPPVPAELMARTWGEYERRKQAAGLIDFEDMLAIAVRMFDEHPVAGERIRARFAAFTVDEYQDVNPLQQALLEHWLGGRDELCVVGDDYQTIYTFTGARPDYLVGFADRHPGAEVVRLVRNYRSTPEVLAFANGLAPRLGGVHKELVATIDPGPAPRLVTCTTDAQEAASIVERCRELEREDVPWSEMAVLYRINARSELFEAAFAAAGIPYQVADGAFLQRTGPRGVVGHLRERGAMGVPLVEAMSASLAALGHDPGGQHEADEQTRQLDMGRVAAIAEEYARGFEDPAAATVEGFLADLQARFAGDAQGRGVQLMTYHRAKGAEYDAVFLPMLVAGELPYRHRGVEADEVEERRLLYVGVTRARRHLQLSYPTAAGSPSPFLRELGLEVAAASRPARSGGRRGGAATDDRPEVPAEAVPLRDGLKSWRREAAAGKPAYTVFADRTLDAIAIARPTSSAQLADIPGVGPAKLERYGADILRLVGEHA